MSTLESLDLKNLHVIVMQEYQTDDIQELSTDFFRNLSNFIGKLKNEEYDGIEKKTKNDIISTATNLTKLLINKRLEKISKSPTTSYSILSDEEKFVIDSNDEMNERKDMIISGIINGKSKFLETTSTKHKTKPITVRFVKEFDEIVGVDLDAMSPTPHTDGKGTSGGYCGPAVKPIALNMVAQLARDPEMKNLPISGIGGVTVWKDAAEFMALGAGNVQVCTAAMAYGFGIVKEMISGLSEWMDSKGYTSVDQIIGKAVPNVTDWQYLNLNYVVKAKINQDSCIQCGRCHIVCEDTSHQAITSMVDGKRHFEVIDDECVGCNLCVSVCPVQDCITMEHMDKGVDPRTKKKIGGYENWTTHPNNPSKIPNAAE